MPQRNDARTKLYCPQCKKWMVPVEGVNAIWAQGCWWCAKHADVISYAPWDEEVAFCQPVLGCQPEGKLAAKVVEEQP